MIYNLEHCLRLQPVRIASMDFSALLGILWAWSLGMELTLHKNDAHTIGSTSKLPPLQSQCLAASETLYIPVAARQAYISLVSN